MNNKYSIVVEAATASAQKELEQLGKRAEGAFDRARAKAVQFETGVTNMWRGLKSAWVEIAAGALAVRQAYDMAFQAAKFQEREQAFANLAASHGQSAQQIIADLRRMSGQTLDTMTIMEKAGTAMTLGIPAEKLAQLMEIARSTAKVTGQEVSQAFSDIVTAVGRQSQMILDNLGIIVKVGEANERYAAQLGKTASQLTDAEKKQAFLNATLEAGAEVVERVGQRTDTQAERFQRYQARWHDAMIWAGKVVLTMAQGIEFVFTAAGASINRIVEKAVSSMVWMIEKVEKLPFTDFSGTIDGLRALRDNARGAADIGIAHMSETWDLMLGNFKQAEPIVTTVNRGVQDTGTAAGGAAPKVRKLAEATKDLVDLWRIQADDKYAVRSRALDYEIRALEEAAREGVAAGEKTPKDFWQIQYEERYEVQSRALDAMIQAEEAASKHLVDLSERTAEAMEQNFSDLFFDIMKNKFTSLRDFGQAVLDSLTRATADYLGQLARVALFGEKDGSGGLINKSISWIGDALSSSITSGGNLIHIGAGGTTAFGMHSGGIVGSAPTFYRTVPDTVFASAPRLHDGFAPDEYPAILRRGEGVFTPRQMDALGFMARNEKNEVHHHYDLTLEMQIVAMDSKSVSQHLAQHRNEIVGMVQMAFNRLGQRGPLGK